MPAATAAEAAPAAAVAAAVPAASAAPEPPAFAMPMGWTRSLAEDGDVFFVSAAGEALWLLFLQAPGADGRPVFFSCATGEQLVERPPVPDGDAASAVVNAAGERVTLAAYLSESAGADGAAAAAAAPAEVASEPAAAAAAAVLPEGWLAMLDEEGDTFYYCAATGESSWTLPG